MEQLSCSVCGELFSNKDALAMHMMFHTRGEEVDAKANVAWKAAAAAAEASVPGPADRRRVTSSPDSDRSSTRTEPRRRRETAEETGDRQLTAERVAELKRMAIESSLRASAQKADKRSRSPGFKLSPRPRSVSEDTSVTSTAQIRPLSADDAFKFAGSHYSKRHTFGRSAASDIDGMYFLDRSYRKRHASSSGEERAYERLPNSEDVEIRKMARYDKDFSRYDKSPVADVVENGISTKVCDNHVSSASGPRDSDETSEGYSPSVDNTEAESRSKEKSRSNGSPYLEAIMANEAELVPVANEDAMLETNLTTNLPLREATTVNSDLNYRSRRSLSKSQNPFSFGTRERAQLQISVANGDGLYPKNDYTDSYDSRRKAYSHYNQARNSNLPTDLSIHFGDRKFSPSSPSSLSYTTTVTTTTVTPGNSPPVLTSSHVNGDVNLVESRDMVSRGELGRGEDASDGEVGHVMEARSGELREEETRGSGDVRGAECRDARGGGEARYCPHCEILYLDVTLFHLHMGLHNVNNPWQCNSCGLVCGGRLEFNTHVLHY